MTTNSLNKDPLTWFDEARYGMFIHWGPYSAGGRGEWILNRECIPTEEYTEKYVRNFGAEKYDPREWVALAKAAGMKYMVLTTRHHDIGLVRLAEALQPGPPPFPGHKR